MNSETIERWSQDFQRYCQQFHPFFARSEPREQMSKYLQGLLSPVARKNAWQLAEATGDLTPDRTQRLLYRHKWNEEEVLDKHIDLVDEKLGVRESIVAIDDTSFLKKGEHSVGVKRQYAPTVGKRENCQIGVFLSYITAQAHVLLNRRLYLPEDWAADDKRRHQAKVPEEVEFATKSQLARQMLEQVFGHELPIGWIAADEVYGNDKEFRDWLDDRDRLFMLSVSCTTQVFAGHPKVEEPSGKVPSAKGGRPRTRRRLKKGQAPAKEVGEIVKTLPRQAFQRMRIADGHKGGRFYDWAFIRVWDKVFRRQLPDRQRWLVIRRSTTDPTDIAYYLSNAPDDVAKETLVCVVGHRWPIEQCFEEAKGECGLDEYEVRDWPSWHRHITLSMMAHFWLATQRLEAEKKIQIRTSFR